MAFPAASQCPYCPSQEAYAKLVDADGVTVGVILECVLCEGVSTISHLQVPDNYS